MISHEHKFIFIHIPKCGGSSIESSFGCDLWDKKRFPDHFYSYDLALGRDPSTNKYLQHLTITEIRELKNNSIDDYFSFSFVRNPWSRHLSDFYFYGGRKKCDFKNFLLSPPEDDLSHAMPQFDFVYSPDGELLVDFIGRFENLQEDFNIVCDKIGIPPKKLPHKNTTKHKHYTEYYDEETKQIIAERYAKDIEYFGYKFGE
jgi:hypothetical protein|tara:strand:+ start:6751 stop:7356 length:606 start_codon:yes stop_codon:yes gene_type:complete